MNRPAQHISVSAIEAQVVPAEHRPHAGPIAIVPNEGVYAQAVSDAGGTIGELDDDTRGLVWLTYGDADRLADVLESHPGIEWVQLPYAGVDALGSVLAKHSHDAYPLWTSAKGAYAQPVAEHALVLVLALLRDIPTRVRATSWPTGAKTGISLFGLNVVIIGAGGIARELIRLLEPFGVSVTIVRRSTDPVEGADRTVSSEHLDEVLPEADVVVVAAAFTEGTHKLIGAEQLALLKSSAVLVNIARGGLIDTDALVDALERGSFHGAGLDVTDPEPLPDGHPLWSELRVIITPHSADTPEMTEPLLVERIAENVRAFLGDGRFVGVVDPKAGY
jgi:phosphoglycerate dehydrogenase-like enzyme